MFEFLITSWLFAITGIMMVCKAMSIISKAKGTAVTKAQPSCLAKDLIPDATDKELIYDYVVRGNVYHIIVTPGDVIEKSINVMYKKDNPEQAEIYYKDDGEHNPVPFLILGLMFGISGTLLFILAIWGM